jgi:hypothetical protein
MKQHIRFIVYQVKSERLNLAKRSHNLAWNDPTEL